MTEISSRVKNELLSLNLLDSLQKLWLKLTPTPPFSPESLSNLPSVEVEQWKNVNPLMLASYKYVLISEPEEAIKFFEGKKVKARKSE